MVSQRGAGGKEEAVGERAYGGGLPGERAIESALRFWCGARPWALAHRLAESMLVLSWLATAQYNGLKHRMNDRFCWKC